ncbi:MAG: NADH-quinone oxidoreductase subunit C [Chromatiaceae bacterium]|jgi:NADH-quinone oxidoreductase subunit C|nr:NADH-quinone oxidoreductase subunit C [Chromatiaceae bacterium]
MSPQESRTGDARLDSLADAVIEHFGALGCETLTSEGDVTLEVPREQLLSVATELRDRADLRFEQLIDVCGVDYAAFGCSEWATADASSTGFGRGVERGFELEEIDDPKRFAAVYHLLSVTHNRRLRMRVYAGAPQPMVDSVGEIWSSAGWFEREAFDLFGILFKGHPDLRRILTDYGFVGHPFRKDFPLIGHVEMRYDPEQARVVYEPVTIEPRTLVPRVIRADNRYGSEPDEPSDAPGS